MGESEPPKDPEQTEPLSKPPASTEAETVAHQGGQDSYDPESTMSVPSVGAPSETAFSSDRYTLGAKLGEGGMATVLAAQDSRLDRMVAVKRMKQPLAHDADSRRRFVKEAKILAALAHPGTVSVFDLDGEGDSPFYAMERVQGKTLRELLDTRSTDEVGGRESIAHFVDLFERVCMTLAYAHSKGVIHRDLKPANVMVDADYGTVLVMDWGIAKLVTEVDSLGPAATVNSPSDDRTQVGAVMGTPGYMSPEQLQGTGSAGPQTDVFALGVILYQILTGKKPFRGRTAHEMTRDVELHVPPAPLTINRRIGRELSAICLKALEKKPEDRYPTARELAEDLRRFREYRPVSVVRPRMVDRVVYWVQRRKVLAAALGTLLVAALVVGTLAGMQRWVESRMVRTVQGMVEESYERVQDLEGRLAVAHRGRDELPEDSAARRAADAEVARLRAEVATNQLLLRGRLGGMLGLTFGSSDPRVVELARWQSVRLVEMMIEFENYAMARSLAHSAIEIYEDRNALQLTETEIDRIRELLALAENELPAR